MKPSPAMTVFKVPWVLTTLLTGFILCYMSGQRSSTFLSLSMLFGATMAGFVVFRWTRTGIRIPLEIGILSVFVLWAVGSGWLLANDSDSYRQGVERMVQGLLLAGCVACMASMGRTPAIGFLALTGFGLVLVCYGFLTGDFAAAKEMTERGSRTVAYRATSLTSNPNALGVSCVWALVGLAFLWRKTNRLWQQGLLIGLTMALLAGVVYSGSRKALLLVPLFLLAWGWFCYRKLLLRRASVFVAVGIALIVCVVGFAFVLRNTYVGHRMQVAFSTEEGDGSKEGRIALVEEGIRMVLQQPVAGVGLYQFQSQSRTMEASHNDYVEVAATTGLVGFLLYSSIFVLVTWRLVRIRRRCPPSDLYDVACICLAALVICAAGGLFQANVSNIAFWCFISGVIGFASVAERDALPRPVRRSSRPPSAIAFRQPGLGTAPRFARR